MPEQPMAELQPAFASGGAGVQLGRGGGVALDLPKISATGLARPLRFAALTLLLAGAAMIAPALSAPMFGAAPTVAAAFDDHQLRAVGIAPLATGAGTGLQLGASRAVEPLSAAPARRMPAAASGPAIPAIAAAAEAPIRVRGRITYGLHEALRLAQVSPGASSQFIRLFAGKLDLARDIGADDHFDLVLAGATSGSGGLDGRLLYAAIDRAGASDIRMMKWSANWIDTAAAERRASSMVWPVAGRVSSGFGLRYHPILHFARMHKGVDFAAGWGQPIVAAADGTVTRAGWAGGYGQQVRIAHGNGMATSYSHLGRLTVAPGRAVRAGQLIGYVGSSGLSTGPHLHYEVYRGGVAVNPMSARFVAAPVLAAADLERFRARLGQFMRLAARTPGA